METKARTILVGIFVLAAVAAGFGFVYWLESAGGLGERTNYRIGFEGSVSGLQVGSAVQFNGIRVGEVTALHLDARDSKKVIATIAIATGTPVRADTHVSIDFQGLTGNPTISLKGGSAALPPPSSEDGQPPLLAAGAAASQDLSQSARAALQHVDEILSENSGAFKETIDNLKIFTGALARNSGHVDAIMAALERLAGGGPAQKPTPVFDLGVSVAPPARPAPRGQLAVAEPTAVIALQTQRILTRANDGQISRLGDAEWSDTLPKLVQAKLVQAFEDAGRLEVVPQTEGIVANYQLLINLRSFAILTGKGRVADIEFSAKLVGNDGHMIAARLFHATAPVSTADSLVETPAIVRAFDQAFSAAAQDLLNWIADVS